MYSDVEVAENVDEDFLSALALLHSTDVDSADKLRKMLERLIEKKSDKTTLRVATTQRKSEEFIPYDYRATEASEIVGEFEDQLKLMEISRVEDHQDRVSSISTKDYNYAIVDRGSRSSSDRCTTDLEDDLEDQDIPRISIPDETTGDGIVCKICNGDKLGPLILLECQECQEIYHPLCHQPPVVDIDVYDPRIVWRCGKCVQTSNSETTGAPFVVTIDDDDVDMIEDGSRKVDDKSVHSQSWKFTKKRLRKNEESTRLSCFGRTRAKRDAEQNSPRKSWRTSQKNCSNSRATSHSRKRVGSKLSVSRTSFT